MPPEAKRQKPMPPIEDLEAPPLVDEYRSELQDVIRTHKSHGPVQSRYNFRLMTSDIGGLNVGHILEDQTTAFKCYVSYCFIKAYSHSYRCSKCEHSLWKYPAWFERHELPSEAGVHHVYKGGGYHTTPSVFKSLDGEGITVVDTLRFYPYRATFDFECFFDGENLPTDSDLVQWIARHVPLSVSLASNVPGHETPRCYVTDGDSDKLVGAMMSGISAVSDATFDMLTPSYDNVLNELEVRKEAWDEAEREALKEAESKQEDEEEVEMEEVNTNPYKTLIGQLLGWLHQLPVIVFNSGKCDLNVIKQFFVPYLLKPSKQDDNDDSNDEEE